jgi:hypothetical protein
MEILSLEHDDFGAKLECHFDEYTGSLWHVYYGGHDLYNLLSDAVIRDFERQFAIANKLQAYTREVELAMDLKGI